MDGNYEDFKHEITLSEAVFFFYHKVKQFKKRFSTSPLSPCQEDVSYGPVCLMQESLKCRWHACYCKVGSTKRLSIKASPLVNLTGKFTKNFFIILLFFLFYCLIFFYKKIIIIIYQPRIATCRGVRKIVMIQI